LIEKSFFFLTQHSYFGAPYSFPHRSMTLSVLPMQRWLIHIYFPPGVRIATSVAWLA